MRLPIPLSRKLVHSSSNCCLSVVWEPYTNGAKSYIALTSLDISTNGPAGKDGKHFATPSTLKQAAPATTMPLSISSPGFFTGSNLMRSLAIHAWGLGHVKEAQSEMHSEIKPPAKNVNDAFFVRSQASNEKLFCVTSFFYSILRARA